MTEVLFTARWTLEERIARPWVRFIHSRWDNLQTREAMSNVINSTLVGPLSTTPTINLEMIQLYTLTWPVPETVLQTALRALEDTSLEPLSQGEAAERVLTAAMIRKIMLSPPAACDLAAPLDPFGA